MPDAPRKSVNTIAPTNEKTATYRHNLRTYFCYVIQNVKAKRDKHRNPNRSTKEFAVDIILWSICGINNVDGVRLLEWKCSIGRTIYAVLALTDGTTRGAIFRTTYILCVGGLI